MRSPRSRTSSLRYWASIRTASVAPVIKVEVVGEKVPLGIPGNSTAGMLGQRPAYTVARIGGASIDNAVEPAVDELLVCTEFLQVCELVGRVSGCLRGSATTTNGRNQCLLRNRTI